MLEITKDPEANERDFGPKNVGPLTRIKHAYTKRKSSPMRNFYGTKSTLPFLEMRRGPTEVADHPRNHFSRGVLDAPIITQSARLALLLSSILLACDEQNDVGEEGPETVAPIDFCSDRNEFRGIFITGFCADVDESLSDGTGQIPLFVFNPNHLSDPQSMGALNITRITGGRIYLSVTGEWFLPGAGFYEDGFFWNMEIDQEETTRDSEDGATTLNGPFSWDGEEGAPDVKGQFSLECDEEGSVFKMNFELPLPATMVMPMGQADLGIAFNERATSTAWDARMLRENPDLQGPSSNLMIKEVCEVQMEE